MDYRKIGPQKWELLAPLIYVSADGTVYTVPQGFQTNGPSIPRAFYVTTPPVGEYDLAAVLHDWMYSSDTPVTRKTADQLFREAMQVCGVGRYTRTKIYWAVLLLADGTSKEHNMWKQLLPQSSKW